MELANSLKWTLKNKAGQQVPTTELRGKVVALYFSAHWCPPCRSFTPMLKSFFENVTGGGGNLQIIFVSSDKSEAEGQEYFRNDHGDWLMLDFAQKGDLGSKYGVKGIPSLIVIDAAGKSIADDARSEVGAAVQKGDGAAMQAVVAAWGKHCADWRETVGASLGGGVVAGSAEAMRAARLARLGGGAPPPSQIAHTPASDIAPPAAFTPAPSSAHVAAPAAAMPVPAAPVAIAESTADVAMGDGRVEVDAVGIAQLTSMGFEVGQATQALERANGDVDFAAAMLLEAVDGSRADVPSTGAAANPAALAQLTAMGFGADQATQALLAANGDVGAASAILLGD